jgi:tetratricopeptide (TPR) repeat protein
LFGTFAVNRSASVDRIDWVNRQTRHVKQMPADVHGFAEAVEFHKAGRLADAEQLYRLILSGHPHHADSLNLLGVIAHQVGRHEAAVALASQAIAINSSAATYHLSLGNALKGLGRVDEALACFHQAVKLHPSLPEARNNLAITLGENGRPDEAIDHFERLLKKHPNIPEAHNNLGSILSKQGSPHAAAACFRRALSLNPGYVDAYINLAYALNHAGVFDEAIVAFHHVLRLAPRHPGIYAALGSLFRKQGKLPEAEDCFRKAVGAAPESADALYRLGIVCSERGRPDDAARCFRKALAMKPDQFIGHNNLGHALQDLGEYDAAIVSFQTAVELEPLRPELHNNLGSVLGDRGDLDQAVAALTHALALEPDYPEAISNLGIIVMEQGRLDEAVALFRDTIARAPDFAKGYNNLGIALRRQGLLGEAVSSYRTALEKSDRRPGALSDEPRISDLDSIRFRETVAFNLAMALLARGDLREGWQHYESRWGTRQFARAKRHPDRPQWRGEPAAGKSVLIHAEQGFGDTLQFCRYAPLAAERGLRVILAVQKPLVRLLNSLPGVEQVIAQGDALPETDLSCPMLSLPLAFGTTIETIPSASAYLHADKAQVDGWTSRLGPRRGLRIGLVWAGDSRLHAPGLARVDARRSMAPETLAPLFDVPGVAFFSLQKAGPAAPADFPLIDNMGEMDDFADTAALIATLDLVISVDTAVAHLASALGKEVWIMDRHDPCWRWLSNRRDSPWYPSLRLYRQPCPGDWDSVVRLVAHDLRNTHR